MAATRTIPCMSVWLMAAVPAAAQEIIELSPVTDRILEAEIERQLEEFVDIQASMSGQPRIAVDGRTGNVVDARSAERSDGSCYRGRLRALIRRRAHAIAKLAAIAIRADSALTKTSKAS